MKYTTFEHIFSPMRMQKYVIACGGDVIYNQKYIFTSLSAINEIRNRIAHHEPICFKQGTDLAHSQKDTTNIRDSYDAILKMLRWLGVPEKELIKKHDHVIPTCDKIDRL